MLASGWSGDGVGLFLIWDEGRRVSRGWAGGWSAHPLGGIVCRGHAQLPAFASDPLLFGSRLFKSGSWVFGPFVSFVQNLHQLHTCSAP